MPILPTLINWTWRKIVRTKLRSAFNKDSEQAAKDRRTNGIERRIVRRLRGRIKKQSVRKGKAKSGGGKRARDL
jgi:uncharacterized protein (DUF2252 family)